MKSYMNGSKTVKIEDRFSLLNNMFDDVSCLFDVYPITYKTEKYVLRCVRNCAKSAVVGGVLVAEKESLRIIAYRYNEKKSLFTGHRGKRIGSVDVSMFQRPDRKEYINACMLTIPELKMNIPYIAGLACLELEKQKIEAAKEAAKKEAMRKYVIDLWRKPIGLPMG